MRFHIDIRLTVTFTSKWHTGSGEGSFLVHRLVKQDARGFPYIPGSTFRGIARESCEKLSRTLDYHEPADPHDTRLDRPGLFGPLKDSASPVDRLFGGKYEGSELFFKDLRLQGAPPPGWQAEQARIRMSRAFRTVKQGALFTTQHARPMTFKTAIEGYHDNLYFFEEGAPPYAYCLLIAGLMAIDRVGGDKSTGSGEVSIGIASMLLNGETLEPEAVFDYLDPELYDMSRSE